MTIWVGLLRGVNVGGRNKVPMADLRRLVAGIGGEDPRTLLQSGNVVFSTAGPASGPAAKTLGTALADAVAAELDVRVPVLVRPASTLRAALDADPFAADAPDPRTHLLAFLSAAPTGTAVERAQAAIAARRARGGRDAAGRWHLIGDHGYLDCGTSVHESLFATLDWDKLLGVSVTMRNRDTATKLADLAQV